jgi:[acyl-carrier-protein] S-malonyltransferase
MDRCAAAQAGGLMAASGLSMSQVEHLCLTFGIEVAIHNGSHAVVLGGPVAALDSAALEVGRLGAHLTRLNVGLASHTRWMEAAVLEFAQALAGCPVRAPRVPLFCNAVDRVTSAAQVGHALSQQIAHAVRWSDCMENMHARRVSCVLEVGPGSALARMWNERFAHVPARSVDEFSSAAAIVDWAMRNSRE